MSALTIIHIGLSGVAALGLGALMIFYHEAFNGLERFGIGLMAGGMVMTIGPVISENSPFELWAAALLRVGIILCVIGWIRQSRGPIKPIDARREKDGKP